jgi:hypothetical protein
VAEGLRNRLLVVEGLRNRRLVVEGLRNRLLVVEGLRNRRLAAEHRNHRLVEPGQLRSRPKLVPLRSRLRLAGRRLLGQPAG